MKSHSQIVLASAVFGLAAQLFAQQTSPADQAIADGVTLTRFTKTEPHRMRGYLLRIDLTNPKVQIVTTPGKAERPGETVGVRTSTFAKQNHLVAATNASPFDVVYQNEGGPENVSGLLLTDGKLISPGANHPAILFAKDRAWVSFFPVDTTGAISGVGGFAVVLREGRVRARTTDPDPRTAAGVDQSGHLLYLLVVDGRQRDSEGASNVDVAYILKAYGATDAVTLDGGGTSTMVTADAGGEIRVVNKPVDDGIVGRERVAGSHIGVRILP